MILLPLKEKMPARPKVPGERRGGVGRRFPLIPMNLLYWDQFSNQPPPDCFWRQALIVSCNVRAI